MTREEAINTVSNIYQTDKEKKALEILIPELTENEDEIHRKWVLEYLYDGLQKSDEQFKDQFKSAIAWLEKQKDASKAIEAVERIDKYIDEHLANAQDMKDSNPDKKYYHGWDDALVKMSGILQDVYSEEKQKEQDKCPEYCVRPHCIGYTISLCKY